MRKEVFEIIKRESKYIVVTFFLSLAIFKIIFFKEDFFVLLKIILSLFWLFVIPGYFLMLYWKNLDFTERLVVGIALSAAIIGITSYYLGLIGLHIKFHAILLPLIMILGGIGAALSKL